jgi:hypothetical protein
MPTRYLRIIAVAGAAIAAQSAHAADGADQPRAPGFFDEWQARVHAAQESQPHWITPLATVTPRLEQEVRYDQVEEHSFNGGHTDRYGGGKGLELIPTSSTEVLINAPSYNDRDTTRPASGFADWQFLVVKQRLLSANEEQGNYIVTVFLGIQAPTGAETFTNHAWVVTPTLAAGKGWGDFDIQATAGVPIPTSHEEEIGTALVTNATCQYHLLRVFWPEVELNTTHWFDGERGGKTQVYVTPGLVLGRFPLFDNRVRAIVGAGYQYALAPKATTTPVSTPAYAHAWIFTARLAF